MNNGRSRNAYGASALTDFLLTTNWKPKSQAFESLHFDGFLPQIPVSHEIEALSSIYGNDIHAASTHLIDEYTPFYWSAGLITHPLIASRTRHYQRKKHLEKNKHLWPVAYFFFSDHSFLSNMEYYDHFSCGQMYTGIKLNLYKRPNHGLIVSSFSLYNPHYCGFQQLPWMINLKGIPIWSQSGLGSESVAGFNIHNTNNPAVQQVNDLLLVSYLAPPTLINNLIIRNLFSYKVRLFWPFPLFDNHIIKEYGKESIQENSKNEKSKKRGWFSTTSSSSSSSSSSRQSAKNQSYLQNLKNIKNIFKKEFLLYPTHEEEYFLRNEKTKVWCIGKYENLYIAILCTKPLKIDYQDSDDGRFQDIVNNEKYTIMLPRLVCEEKYHSWIIIVGTNQEYATIEAFIDQRISKVVVVEEERDHHTIYYVDVIDGNHHLNYHYDLKKKCKIET
jgi:hypothetical protein